MGSTENTIIGTISIFVLIIIIAAITIAVIYIFFTDKTSPVRGFLNFSGTGNYYDKKK